jgi:hypothetical protein
MTTTPAALTSIAILAAALAGCARLTPSQDAGWQAFHACQQGTSSAALEDLLTSGRVNYRTQEGVEFSTMKACMERHGYACDMGVTLGSRPNTHCYPRAS